MDQSALSRRGPGALALAAASVVAVLAGCVPPQQPPAPTVVVSQVPACTRPYRWSRSVHHPLRVWIEPTSRLRGWTPEHITLTLRAMRAWEGIAPAPAGVRPASAIGAEAPALPVVRVFSPDDAEIRVRWTDGLPAAHPGITLLAPDARGDLTGADVWINVSVPPRSNATASEVLYGVIAHELGHALGLPHAPERSSLMHAVLYTLTVTTADLDELRFVATGTRSLRVANGAESAAASPRR